MNAHARSRFALGTVFLVVLIDLVGFGIVLPNLAFYAAQLNANPSVIGLLYSVYSLAQLIFSPVWGSLSDRVGRRPVMLLSTLGSSASYVLFAYSGSLPLLFLSRLLAGVMAGNVSTAQAYVADVTTPENRARGMGLIGAAFGIGFVLGPAIGAAFSNRYTALGLVAAALSAASFFMVLLCLPESIDLSCKNDPMRIAKLSVLTPAFWRSLKKIDEAAPTFPLLMLSVFLLAFGQSSLYGAFPLFCKERLFLSPLAVGVFYMWMGIVAILIQGGLIRVLVKRFGEKRLFFMGCLLFATGLFFIPFSEEYGALAALLILMTVGASLAGPTLNSMISQTAGPGRYGAVLGSSQGLSALGRAIGPWWGGWLYSRSFFLPFVLTGLLVSPAFLSAFLLNKSQAND